MKKLIEKDKARRFKYNKVEKSRLALRVLQRLPGYLEVLNAKMSSKNEGQPFSSVDVSWCLSKLDRNSAKVRIRNRCVITGRGHSVYRAFGISRIELREWALKGRLPFVKKSSW